MPTACGIEVVIYLNLKFLDPLATSIHYVGK